MTKKCKFTKIWHGEKRITEIWKVEIDFLDTQKVRNDETFQMSNTWIAAKLECSESKQALLINFVTVNELAMARIQAELLK